MAMIAGVSPAHATIYGTLSNFDIYNTTAEPAEGAEIELEGVHSNSFGGDFPAQRGPMGIRGVAAGPH